MHTSVSPPLPCGGVGMRKGALQTGASWMHSCKVVDACEMGNTRLENLPGPSRVTAVAESVPPRFESGDGVAVATACRSSRLRPDALDRTMCGSTITCR